MTTRFLASVLFFSAMLPLAAQETMWKTQDSLTWNESFISYRKIVCADSQHCAAIGFVTNILNIARHTNDGGNTWRTVFIDSAWGDGRTGLPQFRDAAYPDPRFSILVADSGVIYRSDDSCRTWERIESGTTYNLWTISMSDPAHGIIGGGLRTLLRTIDSGKTWQSLPPPPEAVERGYGYNDVVAISPTTFVAAMGNGDDRAIFRTTDGGASWRSSARYMMVSQLYFVDSLYGWAAGRAPFGPNMNATDLILATTDGGESWSTQLSEPIPPDFGLYDLAFADRNHGIAVGLFGKILHTSDGGAHWEARNLPSTWVFNIPGIAYPTPTKAWIASVKGQILHYDALPAGVPSNRERERQEMMLAVAPNPATDAGTATFLLPDRGEGRVSMVNGIGEEVAMLYEGELHAGVHSVRYDASGLPSGLYIIRASFGGWHGAAALLVAR